MPSDAPLLPRPPRPGRAPRGRVAVPVRSRVPSFALALGLALAGAAPARADGLADLTAALQRLQATSTPLRAQADLKTWHRIGDGRDATEAQAEAAVGVEDGPRGLQVLYGRELLGRLDEERHARALDPQAKTPTLDAMSALDVNEVLPVAASALSLQRRIERARFVGEKAQVWNGRPARLLSFAASIETLNDRERKYVKQFDAGLDVWIGADGTPLASREHLQFTGRAYVVVSFQFSQQEDMTFAVAGDRLVATRRETHSLNSGMGDRDERRTTMTLQWGS
jgi:hypothetical protein